MPNPYYDSANQSWKIKLKVGSTWKPVTLGRGTEGQPIPVDLLTMASPFMAKPVKASKDGTGTTNCPTVGAYSDLYQKRYLKRAESIRRLKCVLSHFLRFASQSKIQLLNEIGIKEINSFIDWRRDQGTANSTLSSDLAMIQGMFTMAVEEKIVPDNPVKSPASKVRESIANEHANREDDELSEEIKYYTRDQQSKILKTMDIFAMPKYGDAVRVMLATGMRVNALVNLDFKWINTDGYVRVPPKWDKGKTGYTTYLFGHEVKRIIERRCEHFKEGKVFPDLDSGNQVYQYLSRFYLSHGLPDIADMGSYCHAWRHTYAVNRVDDGMTIEVLQQFMGHKNIKVTQRYAKVSNDALVSAVAMVENKMNSPTILY